MKREMNIWVLGGDMRQLWLARLLAEDGHSVHALGVGVSANTPDNLIYTDNLTGIERSDCIILPMPVADGDGYLIAPLSALKLEIGTLFDVLSPRQVLLGGRVNDVCHALAHERGLHITDYFAREELVVANAVPTAEGAIQIAMEEMPCTIQGAKVLVIGYGRVGSLTAQRFAALGAKVSVAARRFEQLSLANCNGFSTERIGQLAGWLCGYDLVVNTVPSQVLGEVELIDLRPECLIIDLASHPGGVDFETAKRLDRQVIWALSLPGKVAPATAGAIIKGTVYNIFYELGL